MRGEVQSTRRREVASKTHGWGGRGTRGAHREHLLHGRDLGRVEAERLVERRRALPRVEATAHAMRGKVQTGRREAAGDSGVHAACRRALGCSLGAGHGEERTRNMPFMFVTLEVSKLT